MLKTNLLLLYKKIIIISKQITSITISIISWLKSQQKIRRNKIGYKMFCEIVKIDFCYCPLRIFFNFENFCSVGGGRRGYPNLRLKKKFLRG